MGGAGTNQLGQEATVVLYGASSEIGNAIVKGLRCRTGARDVFRLGRLTSSSSFEVVQPEVFLGSVSSEHAKSRRWYLVLSVGAIKPAIDAELGAANLSEMIETNSQLTIDFLENFLSSFGSVFSARNPLELHFVSSVLSDFAREESIDYSLSKFVIERKLLSWSRENRAWLKLFVWKPAYVNTKFHPEKRKYRSVEISLEDISKVVARRDRPGVRYLPSYMGALAFWLGANFIFSGRVLRLHQKRQP